MIEYDSKNWSDILLRMRGSVVPALLPRILICAGLGALAAWLFDRHGARLPSIAHTLLGVALGLLLVFRTNASGRAREPGESPCRGSWTRSSRRSA